MRNHKLETEIFKFIKEYEPEYIDEKDIVKNFVEHDPLYLYDAIKYLRVNKLIERKDVGMLYYYKTKKLS